MFKQIHAPETLRVTLTIAGEIISVAPGTTVAAASLLSPLKHTRSTPVSGATRAPYCLMGVCFDCLMTIDGRANQRACQTIVREGMVVEKQVGKRDIAP